jgi:splicing factor U2AF subunit
MADRLARVYGTEDDKVNCSYYHKTGACRHGAVCGRKHNAPLLSQTLLLKHVWANPASTLAGDRPSAEQAAALARNFEDMYIDVFDEMSKYGEVEEMHVCENLCDHMVRAK